jgi:hypothetical protein
MNRKQAEQAVGSEVWTSWCPKAIKSRWMTGPYLFEKITKGGLALLREPEELRIMTYGTITVNVSEIFTR